MPKVEVGDLLEASRDCRLSAAPERRVSEQLIMEWEQERRRLGNALALMALDVSAMTGPKWAYRFIIAICPVVEDCSLIFYGANLAALMQLPKKPDCSAPKIAQIPARYVPVFTKGCIASTLSGAAVPDAWCNRPGRRARGALPCSIYPLAPRWESSAAPRARRVQLPSRRTAELVCCGLSFRRGRSTLGRARRDDEIRTRPRKPW
jgi:hypothetical protein